MRIKTLSAGGPRHYRGPSPPLGEPLAILSAEFPEIVVAYIYLAIAIISEVIGTSALKATHEFTRLVPSIIVVLGYGSAFFFLTLALRTFPVGIAYAIWSGVGIVLVCLAGYVLYNQTLDAAALIGMAFIVAGVIILNGFSSSVPH